MYDRAKALFLSIWRGQRSLTETFWLWYFGVVVVAIYFGGLILVGALRQWLVSDEPALWYLGAVLIGTIWSNVGLWRSASRSGSIWGILVRVLQLIVFAVVAFVFARMFSLV